MKVALLTTWDEKCGIAEYARNLVAHAKNTEFQVFGRDTIDNGNAILNLPNVLCGNDCCIMHFNYEPGLFYSIDVDVLTKLRGKGMRLVMTLHTSGAGNNRNGLTGSFDRVVVHEQTTEGFEHVPMGLPEVQLEEQVIENRIGTAGFPFPWKGFHQVAQAAKKLDMGCLVVAPKSDHCDTDVMEHFVRDAQPDTEYIKDWLLQEDVIRKLAKCKVNVFAYDGANSGISGAVRMGLAARRPLVVTRCRQFRDLYDYEDEIEFIEDQSPDQIAEGISRVLASGKKPKRVLEDMSWGKAAQRYEEIYASLV